MHSLAYALLPIEEANSSEEARTAVYDFLVNDASFMADSNATYRFWSPMCDRFSIGGGFSGNLNPQSILDEFDKKAEELKADKDSLDFTHSFVNENKEVLNKIWRELGGQLDSPLTRYDSKSYGYEDDAKIIDEEIVEKIKKLEQPDVFGNKRILDCSSDNCYCEINNYKELIGKAWLVVIAYHN